MDQCWLFEPDYSDLFLIEKPVTDNDFLQNAQYHWLVDGSKKAKAEMWLKSISICKKLIRKEMKMKEFYLPEEEIRDKAVEAVEYVFRSYNRKFAFKIKKFVGALYFGVSHALYYQNLGEKVFTLAMKMMNTGYAENLGDALIKAKHRVGREQRKKRRKAAEPKGQLEFVWE